jgi:cytochrome P450
VEVGGLSVPAHDLPSVSLADSIQFNELVIVPNALQGLFKRRPGPVAAATKVDLDGRAIRFVAKLRKKHGPGPVWVRVMADSALLDTEDVARTLDGSPHPFAPDPEAKRKGMSHFQPDALTLSRGELWANRRAFAEAVLETPTEVHSLAPKIRKVVAEEVDALLDGVDADGALDFDAWHAAFRRIVRRVVLGNMAAADEELSDLLATLMSEANGLPEGESEAYAPYMNRLSGYVTAAEKGSLVSLLDAAPSDPDTRVASQVTHWLFAMQDTLALNCFRALALLSTHPEQKALAAAELKRKRMPYLAACLQEAMRLYPTTPLLSRELLVDVAWNGSTVPAGTQVLIVNGFHHRDRQAFDYADRFAPEAWTEGDAASQRAFNHFSSGPQGCPGRNLALLVGTSVLAQVLRRWPDAAATAGAGSLHQDNALPYSLNPFALEFGAA